jgi:hypothetical protein
VKAEFLANAPSILAMELSAKALTKVWLQTAGIIRGLS